jgi:eukaryotic-like serine/threonine-protein kinase
VPDLRVLTTQTPDIGVLACRTPPPGADSTDGAQSPAAPPVATELAPGDVFGCYRIERVLGTGGMGAAYLATDTQLGRQVAVKTMRPDVAAEPHTRERFLREARAAAAIEHENVVPVYAVGDADGSPYLVMPLLRGEALDARLERGAWPSLAEVCRLAREVAAGLAAAHAVGLVHRDVKPANVWLDGETGRARLIDFGLARQARGGDALTRAGVVLGTPAYMAPEQAAGAPVDHRADLFSLGVLLYELTTRRRPFVGDSVLAVLTALAVHDPQPAHEANPEAPVALSRLIARLLAKTPDDRPASAGAVVATLAAIESAPAPQPPAVPGEAVGKWNRARALLFAGFTIFGLVLGLLLRLGQ